MSFLLALLEKLGLGALAAWLGHKTDVAKEAGADEQIIKDQAAGAAITRDAVNAASDADHQRVLLQNDPAKPDPSPDPDLPYRD